MLCSSTPSLTGLRAFAHLGEQEVPGNLAQPEPNKSWGLFLLVACKSMPQSLGNGEEIPGNVAQPGLGSS